jgi:hypothetical protein
MPRRMMSRRADTEDRMNILDRLLSNSRHMSGADKGVPEPASLGRSMTALYRCWDRRARLDLEALTAGFLDRLGRAGDPIGRACLQVAGDVTRWGGHPYHSTQHHAEVATNTMVLIEIASRIGQPIPPRQRAVLLAASLAHDIGYEPDDGQRARFAAEAHSARTADVINCRYGLDQTDRVALGCLILATEPAFRPQLAQLLRRPGALADVPAPLQMLVEQPELTQLAAVLSDADLLSSVGLTLCWHRVQLNRLERELGQRILPADDLRFFERIVGEDFLSSGGRHFSSNLARIRRAVQSAAAPPSG